MSQSRSTVVLSEELLKKLYSVRQKESQNSLKKVIIEYDPISGGKYEGEVNKKGQWHGYGTYTDKVGLGRREEGYWKNGMRHGHFEADYHDGNKYKGEYQDGSKNGQGTYTFHDGAKYVGEWKDGVIHGHGTHTWSDGSMYVGEWKDGWKHGQGTFTQLEGDKYEGEWKDGKFINAI